MLLFDTSWTFQMDGANRPSTKIHFFWVDIRTSHIIAEVDMVVMIILASHFPRRFEKELPKLATCLKLNREPDKKYL
ncbi:hypothetical protein HY26_04205 [Hyphomonas sp. GM-8P]|nr:hypothetical protein HY26_04205 [Hyphomonas sp. GM-8P]